MNITEDKIESLSPDQLVGLHYGVISSVAKLRKGHAVDLRQKVLLALENEHKQLAEAANLAATDREQARIIALCACVTIARGFQKDTDTGCARAAELGFIVEGVRDDLHRDVLFGHYWNQETREETGAEERLKPLTVAQNRKRALKFLKPVLGTDDPDAALSKWKATRERLGPVASSPAELLRGLKDREAAAKLPAADQDAIVDAMAAVVRTYLLHSGFLLGPRSLRETFGRPVIELPQRLGVYEKESLIAAEEIALYDATRKYTLRNLNEGWHVVLTHVYDKFGVQKLSVSSERSDMGVAILDQDGRLIGTCMGTTKPFEFTTPTLPFSFAIRGIPT